MEHEHNWEQLIIIDQQITANIAHYKCKDCGSLMVKATQQPGVGGLHPKNLQPKTQELYQGQEVEALSGEWE